MKHNFVDFVKIYFKSGKGGAGAVSWRREKYVPRGGPDGGDGGKGGDILLRGNAQYWTLLDLKYRKFINAGHGEPGKGKKQCGRSGTSEILDVPLGTVARDADTGEILGEISEDGEELLILKGGRGGQGNWSFRSPTNQTPEYAQPGEPGQERVVILELKLLADVGLVGFPNAGKSTLLSVLTEARPEIAAYPFTTLVPNLGIVRYRDFQSFVMADIPGIIEGASQGKGLGTQFLRHIERNAVLLLMVPLDASDIDHEFQILEQELESYDPLLLVKPCLKVLTKADLLPDTELETVVRKYPDALVISSVQERGLDELKDRIWSMLVVENAPVN